jgi:hypothetical protein
VKTGQGISDNIFMSWNMVNTEVNVVEEENIHSGYEDLVVGC